MIDSLDILRTDDFIEHHVVKGMKWGVRKARHIQRDLNRLEIESKSLLLRILILLELL